MDLLNLSYRILVSPVQEFRVISLGPVPKGSLLAFGTAVVFLVSALGVVYSPMVTSTEGLLFQTVLGGLGGVIFWIFTAAVFSTTAYVFCNQGRPQTLLILTAFATLPWIFLPVVMLFKPTLGGFGQTVSIFGCLGLWLWTSVLFLLALKFTYDLSLERIILAAGLPLLMTFLGVAWVGGFFFNLLQFFS